MSDQEVKVGDTAVPGPRASTRGAQVRLTGDAQEAARGAFGTDTEHNTVIKRQLEQSGAVPDGLSPDGSTVTGEAPAEEVVTREGEPSGEVPARQAVDPKEPQARPQADPAAPPTAQPKK